MTTNMQEAKDWARSLSEEPNYATDDGTTLMELPLTSTVEQLRSALVDTRTQASLALSALVAHVEKQEKELDKLRNHRHDNSKQFGGRPEF